MVRWTERQGLDFRAWTATGPGAPDCLPLPPQLTPPLTVRQGVGFRTCTAHVFSVAEVKSHHLLGRGASQNVLI